MIQKLIYLYFFFSMLGMGFLNESFIGIPGVPYITIPDIIFVILLFYLIRDYTVQEKEGKKFSISLLIKVTLAAILCRLILNIFEFLPVFDLVKNSSRFTNYFSFFFVMLVLKEREDVEKLLDGMQVLFLIGCISFFIQYLFKLNFNWAAEYSEEFGYRIRHVIFPMALIWGLLNFSMMILNKKKKYYFVFFLLASCILILSMYRNYYVVYPLGLLIVFLLYSIKIEKNRKSLIKVLVLITIGVFVLGAAGIFNVVNLRFLSMGDEIGQNTGTFAVRMLIWSVKFEEISNINPLLGIGFNWDKNAKFSPGDSDEIATEYITNPFTIDADNGYATIFVILGWVGIILFISLYIVTFRVSLKLLNNELNTVEKSICLTAASFSVIVLISNFGLDNFYWPYAVLPNMVLLALVNFIHSNNSGELKSD